MMYFAEYHHIFKILLVSKVERSSIGEEEHNSKHKEVHYRTLSQLILSQDIKRSKFSVWQDIAKINYKQRRFTALQALGAHFSKASETFLAHKNHSKAFEKQVPGHIYILVLEPALLLVSTKNRNLWPGPLF